MLSCAVVLILRPRRAPSSPRGQRPLSWLVPFVFCAIVSFTTTSYAADVSGKWQASSLRVSWAIGDWGEACGPRPSGGGEKGGTVTLTQSGADFRLSGLGRSYSTTQCWERMPDLTPRSHSAGSSTIATTCKMPAGDPRQATVTTTWYPRGDEIYFDETGQYQFVVSKSNCTASVRRTRVLTRIVEKPQPAAEAEEQEETASEPKVEPAKTERPTPAPQPTAKPAPQTKVDLPVASLPPTPERASRCEEVGPPAQLEVTPKTKLMRPGESFTFQAVARDDQGCRVDVDTNFKLLDPKGATLARDGTLTIAKGAQAGDVRIVATVGDKSVEVGAKVVSEDEFERLMAGGGYGVLGESQEGASITLSSSHVEFDAQEDADAQKRSSLLWIVAGLLFALGTVAAILLFRNRKAASRRAASRALREETSLREKKSLREELPDRTVHSKTAPPAPEPAPEKDEPSPPAHQVRLCPVCGKRYDDGTMFCVEDGARLVRSN